MMNRSVHACHQPCVTLATNSARRAKHRSHFRWITAAIQAIILTVVLVIHSGEFNRLVIRHPNPGGAGPHRSWTSHPLQRLCRVTMRPNMDVLVALGSVAALVATGLSIYYPKWWPVENETAPPQATTIIVTVVLIGRWLEARIRHSHLDAVHRPLSILPTKVKVIRNEAETEAELDSVESGEVVAVRGNQTIPVDGVVVHGNGTIDESFLTGKRCRANGQLEAWSGRFAEQAGLMRIEATRTGSDTTIFQMGGLLERVQLSATGHQGGGS